MIITGLLIGLLCSSVSLQANEDVVSIEAIENSDKQKEIRAVNFTEQPAESESNEIILRDKFYSLASLALLATTHTVWHNYLQQFNDQQKRQEACEILYNHALNKLHARYTDHEEELKNFNAFLDTIGLGGTTDLFIDNLFDFINEVTKLLQKEGINSQVPPETFKKMEEFIQYTTGNYTSVDINALLLVLEEIMPEIVPLVTPESLRLHANYSTLLDAMRILYIANRSARIGCVINLSMAG